jgi:arylsulfatase A-like enzyme
MSAQDQPNIIFIMADDWGMGTWAFMDKKELKLQTSIDWEAGA